MRAQADRLGYEISVKSITNIVFETIKIGIIKSNLISMFAGLCMALYVSEASFFDKIGDIVLALIGTTFVIGAAGAFNNVYDRDIDIIMERTKKRPTVTGQVSAKNAILVGSALSVLGVILLYWASPMAALFGFLGLFLYVVPYTMWTKRRTVYNTEVGSLSGATPPLIGWAAISSDLNHPALLAIFLLMLVWQMPHFYAIAIRRMEEYKAASIPMLPVVYGLRRTYYQQNFYLILLIATSALFWSFSPAIAIVNAVVSVAWLVLSIVGYRRMPESGWSKTMFIYSLYHMTFIMLVIIGYSLIKPLI
ncbi:heme o synthase [Cohnella thailandensis]|uniref:Protoheme IX farnesyltransferase n=1 Tax=Cohnella thailandensis TaxID=557557 RepID=A0A841T726_9BACL|nr:heme o synthase [Cohnella thailandensis]MBB6636971.1 protoheme IX farnesyltransferase [Cohnella thailandensis]MBP1973146.1 protoheme IX farnesyltransferase [Cohnella thailandensis]